MNVIEDKSFEFSVRAVKLYKYLIEQKQEYYYPSNFFAAEQA